MKRGRPYTPPDEKRNIRVEIKLIPNEFKSYRNLAYKNGLTISEWIRTILNRKVEEISNVKFN